MRQKLQITSLLIFISLFLPKAFSQTVTDVEGQIYKTVVIGNLEWMAENLNTAKYSNGDLILHIEDSITWDTLTRGAWVYYQNDSSNYAADYGKYYNWEVVNDSRNVCPTGWRVPSDADWDSLSSFIGGSSAGGKLKDSTSNFWNSPNSGASDDYGFKALPGGRRIKTYPPGNTTPGSNRFVFENIGEYAYFWSSWNNHPTTRKTWELEYNRNLLWKRNSSYLNASNIRCVKNATTGLNENTGKVFFEIYPNPSDGWLTIKTGPGLKETEVRLYNILGVHLESHPINTDQIKLDLSKYAKGIYFVELGGVVKKLNIIK